MGEVGVSTGENPTELHTMNGDLNGSCEEDNDEPMDVDPLESPRSKNNYESRDSRENTIDDVDEKSNITEDSSTELNQLKDDKDQTQSSIPDDEDNLLGDDSDEEKQNACINEDSTQQGSYSENGNAMPNVEDEIHDIPDSDEEESLDNSKTTRELKQTTKTAEIVAMDVDGASNGHASIENDDDKPVSIHSDSEDELGSKANSNNIINKKTEDKLEATSNDDANKNGDCVSPEVHEILSDKEDCIVVEDKDDLSPRRSQRQRKSVVKVRNFPDFDDDIQEITDPLQSGSFGGKTTIRSKITAPITNQFSQNIALTSTPNQISIKDARSLAAPTPALNLIKPGTASLPNFQQNQMQNQFSITNNNKKEPTLVIIDTNSILQGRGGQAIPVQSLQNKNQNAFSVLPVGVPAQGIYPPNVRTSITPISSKPISISTQAGQQQILQSAIQPQLQAIAQLPQLLPALTDDMFVLEAPSFIVPYIYEKPPSENLKEIVTKIAIELEENKKKEEQERIRREEEKGKKVDETNQESTSKELPEDTETKNDTEKKAEEIGVTKPKKKKPKSGDDSWDESDTSTDEEASDSEQRTKILIKEIKEDLDNIKQHIITPDSAKDSVLGISSTPTPAASVATEIPNTGTPATTTTTAPNVDPIKKTENYFESPLGNFFMTIGINLVQEHVQTDLLRQQKKRREKDGTKTPQNVQVALAINSLMKNLVLSREKNEPFKFDMKRCEYCNFKSESSLAMAHHYETPHMRNYVYKCNFCTFETRPPHDILFHMEAVHNIKGRLEKALSYHQCPNCPFEDNGKSKLARHSIVCAKKFRPEMNLAPPADWEPPAKIPRIKPKHGLVGTATAYQAMAAQQQRITSNAIPRHLAAAISRQRGVPPSVGRLQPLQKPSTVGLSSSGLRPGQNSLRTNMPMMLPNNYQMGASTSGQFLPVAGSSVGMMSNSHSSLTIQSTSGIKSAKSVQQPSISITPLPRQAQNTMQNAGTIPKPPGIANLKPGQSPSGTGKSAFVICEICDGYIKDLDQLRNHMQWIHKIKIHPKMIYNRPPLNCQKCQYRFFTDQGLERHLLGSHGLVTSSMQEAANKGKDAGRCPVCGRVYQWKLLNHVSRDHNMTLKPAHLSYKCTVCTATFGMYKQFENHVYSAHSTVAKKSIDSKKNAPGSSSALSSGSHSSKLGGDSLLKPLKINDEITIIPQPATKHVNKPMEIESHVID